MTTTAVGPGGGPDQELPTAGDPAAYPLNAAPGPPPVYGRWHQPTRLERFAEAIYSRPKWLMPLLIVGCMGAAAAYVSVFNPTDDRPDPGSGCIVRALTGYDCPGCGGTRAFWYVLHGNLPEAARHHAMAVFALPFLVWLYVAWAGQRIFNWKMPMLRLTPRTIGIFLLAWGGFTVLRNLPWPPFTWFYV